MSMSGARLTGSQKTIFTKIFLSKDPEQKSELLNKLTDPEKKLYISWSQRQMDRIKLDKVNTRIRKLEGEKEENFQQFGKPALSELEGEKVSSRKQRRNKK